MRKARKVKKLKSKAPEIEVLPAEDLPDAEPEQTDRAAAPPPVPAAQRQIVPFDPLVAYLREIRRYPRLSREEEHDLAVAYYEHKDLNAAYRLVASNLWLVVRIAREYERAARSVLDLIQEGNIGLMEAVKNFDPYRGVRFPSYAVWWIRAYIVRFVIANWRMVKIGTTQAQRKLFFNLKKERERLEREGFDPGPKLLAEKLNVRERDVIEMEQRLGSPDMSMDAPVQPGSEHTMLAMLPSPAPSAEDLLSQKQTQELIRQGFEEFAATLNEKELVVFKERMLGDAKVTLQDLAEKLSLSRERIRQIESRIREKLKEFLQERFGRSLGLQDLEP